MLRGNYQNIIAPDKYRLLYGRGVPLGHIGTGVAISARGLYDQYDLEAHLNHIITFLLHPHKQSAGV